LHITASDGSVETFVVPLQQYSAPEGYKGFVEGDGYVAMEAGSTAKRTSMDDYDFVEMDNYGRTKSGLEMFPMTAQNFTVGAGPSLEYDFLTHSASQPVNITLDIGPSLNFLGKNKTLAFGFSLDDSKPLIIRPVPTLGINEVMHLPAAVGAVPYDWYTVVENEVRKVVIPVEDLGPGEHTITLYGMTTGVIFERIVVDLGGVKARAGSYLGPPESVRLE
jgi:hypothetical protein